MTREEALNILHNASVYHPDYLDALNMAIEALEQEPKSEWEHDHDILKAHSDGANEVLDKVRAEIESLERFEIRGEKTPLVNGDKALEIIDKYKAESEG